MVCKTYYHKFNQIFFDMWILALNKAKKDAVDRDRSQITEQIFLVKHLTQNFTKMNPAGAKLFHADGWTDGNDEANSCFLQLRERTKKEFRKGCHRVSYCIPFPVSTVRPPLSLKSCETNTQSHMHFLGICNQGTKMKQTNTENNTNKNNASKSYLRFSLYGNC
jgi:hypothetical protein